VRCRLNGRTAAFGLAGLLACFLGGGCLDAKLENGFDLKGPKGLLGYIGGVLGVSPGFESEGCAFDKNAFDACRIEP
jgi:hypothetical protein